MLDILWCHILNYVIFFKNCTFKVPNEMWLVIANKTSVEQPHIEVSPIPVVEGAEVTFDCKVHYEFGVKVALRWTLPHAHLNEVCKYSLTYQKQLSVIIIIT